MRWQIAWEWMSAVLKGFGVAAAAMAMAAVAVGLMAVVGGPPGQRRQTTKARGAHQTLDPVASDPPAMPAQRGANPQCALVIPHCLEPE